MRASHVLGLLAVGLAAVPVAALASHGKVGLWDITVSMSMPNMPQIPPDQLAKMKAMGVTIPNGNTMTVQHCMTAQEVAADEPPQMHQSQDCNMQNVKMTGGMYSADMVCKGSEMTGSGHLAVIYNNDTQYSGKMTFSGMTHGRPETMTNTFSGHWIKADCGDVGH
ncbi:MAG TPA: DUF3617 domain-containing protein [Rhizomicrobium sp.]|jgi:hypothetical protein|nr:DUF3617 domain-containing protein [Rhizomicrobium sp.]